MRPPPSSTSPSRPCAATTSAPRTCHGCRAPHYVIGARDAYELARRYADRLTIREAAARLDTTLATVQQLLRDGSLARTPDAHRPVRADHVDRLLAADWTPPRDSAHTGRIPTTQAASILGLSNSEVTARARTDRLPAVRDRRGRWWFSAHQLDMVVRARHSEDLGRLT